MRTWTFDYYGVLVTTQSDHWYDAREAAIRIICQETGGEVRPSPEEMRTWLDWPGELKALGWRLIRCTQ